MGRLLARPFRRLFRLLTDVGWARGARGNGLWLTVAVIVSGLRLVARLGSRKREVVYSEKLLPGEVLNITHLLEDRKGRPTR